MNKDQMNEYSEKQVHRIISDYNKLITWAHEVATLVSMLRHPEWGSLDFEVELDIEHDQRVHASYWFHGNESFTFPLSYLWKISLNEIEQLEKADIEEQARLAKEEEQRRKLEYINLQNEDAYKMYKELQARFGHLNND